MKLKNPFKRHEHAVRLHFAAAVSLIFMQPLIVPCIPSRQASPAPAQLRLHQFRSSVYGNTRTLRVLLPPGYGERRNGGRRYPVLYLNDGQNLFDAATAVFNPVEWQVDETVDRLMKQRRIAALIVVGVDNAGRQQRPIEYLPYPDEYLDPPVPSPQGHKYPKFLVDEVMPFINRTYRTRTGPSATGVGGSSYGAVAALYAVMSRPGVFGRVLLESPSLYISDERLLKDCANVRDWPERIYVGIGTHETGDPNADREAVALIQRFGEALAKAGVRGERQMVVTDTGGTHREDAWARRLPQALEYLYGK